MHAVAAREPVDKITDAIGPNVLGERQLEVRWRPGLGLLRWANFQGSDQNFHDGSVIWEDLGNSPSQPRTRGHYLASYPVPCRSIGLGSGYGPGRLSARTFGISPALPPEVAFFPSTLPLDIMLRSRAAITVARQATRQQGRLVLRGFATTPAFAEEVSSPVPSHTPPPSPSPSPFLPPVPSVSFGALLGSRTVQHSSLPLGALLQRLPRPPRFARS